MSKTTVTALYLLHQMLFSEDSNIAILANNERTSREILSRIQMAYTNLPLWLQKGVVEWNKGSMLLDNGVKIIAASTSSNSIRGMTINCTEENSLITVRNKLTNTEETITIKELKERIKK
jgi:hypothetical protein